MFTTKQNLSKDKFYQNSNDQLILTGTTFISKFSGDTTSFKNIGIDINKFDFNVGDGMNSSVWDIHYYTDGSLLVCGGFSSYDGVDVGGLVKLDSNGSLDEDFNRNIGTGIDGGGYGQRIAIQDDGKIVILGEFTLYDGTATSRIVRLNANGTRDESFNIGDGLDSSIYNGLGIQSDGKIIVSGEFSSYSGITVGRIARLKTDGGLDDSFVTGSGFDGFISDVLIQDDGKIVVSGLFSSYSGVTANGLIRLNADGGIDETFNIGDGFLAGSEYALRMALQDDGKILMGGTFTAFGGVSMNSIIRINTDGSVDDTFDVGSGVEGGTNTVNSVKVREDGKIVIGGDFDTFNGVSSPDIAMLNSDGSIDETFKVGAGINSNVWVVQSSGTSVYVGGDFTSYDGVTLNRIVKLSTEGDLLAGDVNILVKNSFIGYDSSYSADNLKDNYLAPKSYVDGYIQGENGITKTSNGIVKLGGELTEPTTLSGDGIFSQKFNQLNLLNSYGKGITLQNKFYSSGAVTDIKSYGSYIYVSNDITLIQYDANNHEVLRSLSIPSISTIAVNNDGLYVGGNFSTVLGGATHNRIARFNDTLLTHDNTFIVGQGFNAAVNVIELNDSGQLMVGGSFTSYDGVTCNGLVRLNDDGSIDDTFNIGSGFNGAISTIKIQDDGKILVGGSFTTFTGATKNRIIRLNTDGTIDSSFDVGTGFNSTVNVIEIQDDGKILIGGRYASYSGVTGFNRLIRLNDDGSVDSSFNIGSGFGSVIGTIEDILIDTDKLVVVGQFVTFTGSTYNKILRLNSDGTLDSSFNIGNGFNAIGFTGGPKVIIKLSQSPKEYLVGGAFSTYKGNSTINLALIGDTGSELPFTSPTIELNDTLSYSGNFSSGFTSRSVPDVDYVTGLTSNLLSLVDNGLKRASDTIVLGGALTGQTAISGDVVTLTLDKTNYGFHINFRDYSGVEKSISTSYEKLKIFESTTVDGNVNSMSLLPSTGNILVTGSFSEINGVSSDAIALLSNEGVVDETFSNNVGTVNNSIYATYVDSNENIYVYGIFDLFNGYACDGLVKILSDGTVDSGFTFLITGTTVYTVDKVLEMSDGRLYIKITDFSDGLTNLKRVNTDGSIDESFDIGDGFNEDVYDFAVLSDDSVIVVGGFTGYSGTTLSVPYLVKLTTGGTISETFQGQIFDSAPSHITMLDTTDRFLITGSFTTYGDVEVPSTLVIDGDGVLDETFNTNISQLPDIGTYNDIFVNLDYNIYFSSKSVLKRSDTNGNYDSGFTSTGGLDNMLFVNNSIAYTNDGSLEGGIKKYNYPDFEEYFYVEPDLVSTEKFRYTTDLSSGFTKYSLVDVNYVTGITSAFSTGGTSSVTAGNGLTKSGNAIVLGGPLSGSTEIDGSGNNDEIYTGLYLGSNAPIGDFSLNTEWGAYITDSGGGGVWLEDEGQTGVGLQSAGGDITLHTFDESKYFLFNLNLTTPYLLLETSNDNTTVETALKLVRSHYEVGVGGGAGLGIALGFSLENSAGDFSTESRIAYRWTIPSGSSEYGRYEFSLHSGGTVTNVLSITSDGAKYLNDHSSAFTKHSLVDVNYVTGMTVNVDGKANISGDTFTGKVTFSGSTTDAPLRISPLTNNPSSLSHGDLWINSSNGAFQLRKVATTTTIATISSNGSGRISVGSNAVDQITSYANFTFNSETNLLSVPKISLTGATYSGDFSSGFTTHSLVDVNYVTGLTSTLGGSDAGNGLSKQGDVIVLGGTLTGDTTIEATTANHTSTTTFSSSAFSAAVYVDTEYDDGFTKGNATFEVKHFAGTTIAFDDLNDDQYNQLKVSGSGIEATANGNNFSRYAHFDVSNANQYEKPDEQPQVLQQIVEEDGTINDVLFSPYGFDVSMRNDDGDDLARFIITKTGTTFTDGRAEKHGIEYSGDYSSGFTKHSIVDVNYVTGITSQITPSLTVVTASIGGNVVIDLTSGDLFLLTVTGNVTTFNYTGETVGKQYIFKFIQDTTNKSFGWATGRYRFPFGTSPTLTNPTTNGSDPEHSEDIVSALCTDAGRLNIVITSNLIDN